MKLRRCILLGGAVVGALSGCHNQPRHAAAPPATTQTACAQIRDFLAKHDAPASAPMDMSAGCHFQVTAPSNLNRYLNRQLAADGWTQDPTVSQEAHKSAWTAPTTRCSVLELEVAGANGPGVHGGVGVSGGTHLSPSFGIGIGIGSFGGESPMFNYKIDCEALHR